MCLEKTCPRCGGDLFYDLDERSWWCLQCGHRLKEAKYEGATYLVREGEGCVRHVKAPILPRNPHRRTRA